MCEFCDSIYSKWNKSEIRYDHYTPCTCVIHSWKLYLRMTIIFLVLSGKRSLRTEPLVLLPSGESWFLGYSHLGSGDPCRWTRWRWCGPFLLIKYPVVPGVHRLCWVTLHTIIYMYMLLCNESCRLQGLTSILAIGLYSWITLDPLISAVGLVVILGYESSFKTL